MAGHFPDKRSPQPPPLNEVSPALFRHRRLWQRVAPYRPLFILAGIWVILLAIALVAYDQLLHTTTETPSAQTAQSSELDAYPHQQATGDRASEGESRTSTTAPTAENRQTASAADTTAPARADAPTGGISASSLGILVAACAFGCLVISRQLQAPPRARRSSQRSPVLTSARRPASKPPQPARAIARPPASPKAPQRLAPYHPQAPLTPAPSSQASAHTPPASAPVPVNSAPGTGNTADVTVVASEYQHALDWPKESLINQADLRRQRSLSSYL